MFRYCSRRLYCTCTRNAARIFLTGIQPTGVPHLGNFFGFINKWIQLQTCEPNSSTLILSVVDHHAICTVALPPVELKENILQMTAGLLASGVDPERTILFQQSAIPEHTQLAWILSALISTNALQRLPQYKDKASRCKSGSVPLGLLAYPVLQAADILLYRASHVPVGEDQSQHMNIVADVANAFNHVYNCRYFHRPEQVLSSFTRLRSLRNPSKKMSKSDEDSRSRIELGDSSATIVDKCRRALSDFDPRITYDPLNRPAISNLIDLYCAVTGCTVDEVLMEIKDMNTVQFKQRLAEIIDIRFIPIRERYEELIRQPEMIRSILDNGALKARHMAVKNLDEIMTIIGFK